MLCKVTMHGQLRSSSLQRRSAEQYSNSAQFRDFWTLSPNLAKLLETLRLSLHVYPAHTGMTIMKQMFALSKQLCVHVNLVDS